MAGIDKIYVSSLSEAREFILWCMEHDNECLRLTNNRLTDHLYYDLEELPSIMLLPKQRLPISNFPEVCDVYIAKNCKLDYIIDALTHQYNDFNQLKESEYLPLEVEYPKVKKFKFYSQTSGFRFGDTCSYGIGFSYRLNFDRERCWWYDSKKNQWVDSFTQAVNWRYLSTNVNRFYSLKALKRHVRSLRLPVGTELLISGPFVGQRYSIRITKVE